MSSFKSDAKRGAPYVAGYLAVWLPCIYVFGGPAFIVGVFGPLLIALAVVIAAAVGQSLRFREENRHAQR